MSNISADLSPRRTRAGMREEGYPTRASSLPAEACELLQQAPWREARRCADAC